MEDVAVELSKPIAPLFICKTDINQSKTIQLNFRSSTYNRVSFIPRAAHIYGMECVVCM